MDKPPPAAGPAGLMFREKLTKAGAIQPLFDRFDATLRASGYIAMSGLIVDASLIANGGFSGGPMERPALKRLIADIEAGQIDVMSSIRSTG